jgi:hypothetical protein
MEASMDTINRLDISYNDIIKLKITTDQDMEKLDMQMTSLEALLTDIGMDFSESPEKAVNIEREERVIGRIVQEIDSFIANTSHLVQGRDMKPMQALTTILERVRKD